MDFRTLHVSSELEMRNPVSNAVIQCLPCACEVPSLILNTTKEQENNFKMCDACEMFLKKITAFTILGNSVSQIYYFQCCVY